MEKTFKQFEPIFNQYSHISKRLLFAIMMTESGGNPFAYRYEPEYDFLVTPKEWAKRLGVCTLQTMEKMRT